jgi:hypothetical protein
MIFGWSDGMSIEAHVDAERREAAEAVDQTRREVAEMERHPHSGDTPPPAKPALPSLFGASRRPSVSTSGYSAPPPSPDSD